METLNFGQLVAFKVKRLQTVSVINISTLARIPSRKNLQLIATEIHPRQLVVLNTQGQEAVEKLYTSQVGYAIVVCTKFSQMHQASKPFQAVDVISRNIEILQICQLVPRC